MQVKQRKFQPKWYLFAGILFCGAFLKFFCPGYSFSGMFLMSISLLIPIQHLSTLVSDQNWRKGLLMFELFFVVCLILAMSITGVMIVRSSHGTSNPDAGYLVVLGAGVNGYQPSRSLQERIDGAAVYLAEHPDAIAIVSGGQGDGENITEAQCMFQELTHAGIAPERIWLEPLATSTLENIQFSLDVIEQHTGTRPEKIAIVSSEYHLHRAGMFARSLGIEPELIPATTSMIPLRYNYYLREIFAVWYYSILGGY